MCKERSYKLIILIPDACVVKFTAIKHKILKIRVYQPSLCAADMPSSAGREMHLRARCGARSGSCVRTQQ
jgi:hypothetical protein